LSPNAPQQDNRLARIANLPEWEAALPNPLMHWTHFLSDHFPELNHPGYQTAVERVSFVVVTAMLIGSLIAALTLVAYEL